MEKITKIDLVNIELNSGSMHRGWINNSIGKSDNKANAFGVRVFRDGKKVALSGGSVQGFFHNSNGENIVVTDGHIVNVNEAYVILPQACYNYEGQFTLAIKVIGDGVTETMRIVDGIVDNTYTGGAIAPTGTVPTYQEVLAVYQQMLAAKAGSVRFDISQSLSTIEKERAQTNIGTISNSTYQTKVAELENEDDHLDAYKVNMPLDENNQPEYGTNGQILRTNGDGTTEWTSAGQPTDEQTADAIAAWLTAHPEATTTVQDNSLTETKFTEALRLKTIKDYVTPEMFGAVGDGETDDVIAINAAIQTGKVILLTQQYYISEPITIIDGTVIYGDKICRHFGEPNDTAAIISDGVFFHGDLTGNWLRKIQMFDISLWDRTADDSDNYVFDCDLYLADFRIYGYSLHRFAERMQSIKFDHCNFTSTKGPFSRYFSDCRFSKCYISGATVSENPFQTGLISGTSFTECYFDFWHYVFYPTSDSKNVIIANNIFDACYRCFSGNYNFFGVISNAFFRIKDSTLWSLGTDDWAVFSNGLRNNTRVIGNVVRADYFIHTSLTGDPYPNKDSLSQGNVLAENTKIHWHPYPNDAEDLLNTRVEELNYKTYETLPTASLTGGSDERFNFQIAIIDGDVVINRNGTWKSITLSDEVTVTFPAATVAAHSTKNLYKQSVSTDAVRWIADRYYMVKPTFNLPSTLSYCAYCYTDDLLRIIISNPTDSDVSLPASTWKIKSFRY